jgi:F0F1-type ATP synthase membrane subunit b/b'
MEKFLNLLTLNYTDLTMIIICCALFLVLWQIINKEFFLRYLELVRTRELATDGGIDLAAATLKDADKLTAEYESAVGVKRAELLESLRLELQKVKADTANKLESLEIELNKKLLSNSEKIVLSAKEVRKELYDKIQLLSDSAYEKLIN